MNIEATGPASSEGNPATEPALTLSQALQRAFTAYSAGDWRETEQLCRRVLAVQGQHFEALTLLGAVAAGTGHVQEAAELLGRAAAARPEEPTAHMNYGSVLADLKRLAEALQSYDRALELKPDYFEVHNNRASILKELGRLDEALESYGHALRIKSDDPSIHYNRANALYASGDLDEALSGYDCALRLRPDFAEAHHNRGNVLKDLRRPDQALTSYDRALNLKPDFAEALNGRGNVLKELRRLDEALGSFDQALQVKPDYAEAHSGRGNVLKELRRLDEALASYERALRFKPDFAAGYYNLGNALREGGRLDAALASYDHALAINSDYVDAHCNRGHALYELQRLDEARDSYVRALTLAPELPWLDGSRLLVEMHLCDWKAVGSGIRNLAEKITTQKPATTPFSVVTLVDDLSLQLKAARIWVSETCAPIAGLPPLGRRTRDGKIRLGYYSADFHGHATAYLIAGLIEQHDRNQFEVVAFSFGPDSSDETRKRLAAAFDRFIDVRTKSDRDVAELSRGLGIDIAVDLKGYTLNARSGIFAHRAAPVQVNYLGYPGTMGAPYIDYLIADATLIPPESRAHYTENIVYLPHSYQVNDRKRPIADRTYSREELGLPPEGFVFCCFNNSYKITPGVFDAWMRLLRQVDGSVLWLLADNATAAESLQREAASRGVDAQRLVFAPRLPLPEHLARHRVADLFLDTLPCNAHTTASDALWTGVPVLTQMGESFAARVAGSLLTAMGVPELTTGTVEQYEALALELATQPARLTALKQRLERNRLSQPLFDTPLYARHLEQAYRQMHERYQADLGPESIRVTP
jgi:predicted O-linked N-acetylglucosamine transferase (SPINDLY family)